MNGRWNDYVFASDEDSEQPETLWSAAHGCTPLASMYVLGVGFDPRAVVGLGRFLALRHQVPPIIALVELPPTNASSGVSTRDLAAENRHAFDRLARDAQVRVIRHASVHSRSSAGPRIARGFTHPDLLAGVGHLVIDISSLPADISFPLIAAALKSADRAVTRFPREIQVVACENPEVDAAIDRLGVGEGEVVGGFRGALEMDSDPTRTVIWAPVIGERANPALRAIHDLLSPGDVCPVLPFPARNPRRGDDLVLEHQVVLLDEFGVDPGNFIYAAEGNPFDLYRTLGRLHDGVQHALRLLQPTTLVLSTHTSKLLSIGVLLAAYENGLPLVSAPALEYQLIDLDPARVRSGNSLACSWIAGAPYA